MASHIGKVWALFLGVTAVFNITLAESRAWVTNPLRINPSRLTPDVSVPFTQPSLAAAGTNVLFSWNVTGSNDGFPIDSPTNAYTSRILPNGELELPTGRLAALQYNFNRPFDLVPADSNFFGVFWSGIFTPTFQTNHLFLVRLSAEGLPTSAPIAIFTNRIYSAPPGLIYASNGRTFLFGHRVDGSLKFDLYNDELAITNNVRVSGLSSFATGANYAVANAGGDYLIAWPANSFRILGTFVDGASGVNFTRELLLDHTRVRALGSNGNQYLLAAQKNRLPEAEGYVTTLLFLSANGSKLSIGSLTNSAAPQENHPPVILPDGDRWVIFDRNATNVINYSITVDGATLHTTVNKYPALELGDYDIAPFGANRFVVANKSAYLAAYQIIDPSGVSPLKRPFGHLDEMAPALAASPDGYLTAWAERGEPKKIQVRRLQKDGTLRDSAPFTLENLSEEPVGVKAAFNGTDFIVVWMRGYESNSTNSYAISGAALSPTAPANPRFFNIPRDGSSEFTILTQGTNILVAQSSTFGKIFIRSISPSLEVSASTDLPFGILVSNGTNLFHIASENQEIWLRSVNTSFDGFTGDPVLLGSGYNPAGVASGEYFLFVWNSGTSVVATRVRLSQNEIWEQRTVATRNAPPFFSLGSNATDFMVFIGEAASSGFKTNEFHRIDAASGASGAFYLPTFSPFSAFQPPVFASAGRDFTMLGVIRAGHRRYITQQWIATAEPPYLYQPALENGAFQLRTFMDEDNQYRIDQSTDLLDWSEFANVSGPSRTISIPIQPGAKFFRIQQLFE